MVKSVSKKRSKDIIWILDIIRRGRVSVQPLATPQNVKLKPVKSRSYSYLFRSTIFLNINWFYYFGVFLIIKQV